MTEVPAPMNREPTEPPESDGAHGAETSEMGTARRIDEQASHLWMVRTFLKHCDEAEDDEDLREIVREIYDFILALGPLDDVREPRKYIKQAKKKIGKLRRATEFYEAIRPELSGHTNFVMAAKSLRIAVDRIGEILDASRESRPPG